MFLFVSSEVNQKENLDDVDGVVQGWASSVRIAPEPSGSAGIETNESSSADITVAQLDAEKFRLDKSVGAWSVFTGRFSSLGTEGR